MKLLKLSLSVPLLVALAACFSACTHTTPGTSVEVALAKKAEVVRLPEQVVAAQAPKPQQSSGSGGGGTVSPREASEDRTILVAGAYSRGEFCLKTGNVPEAITALQEVVKLDPNFPGAWQHLATLYELNGQSDQAMAAYKRSKQVTE